MTYIIAPTCADNVKNGNETDKDCGGHICSVCVPGKGCKVPTDCSIGMCMSNICQCKYLTNASLLGICC